MEHDEIVSNILSMELRVIEEIVICTDVRDDTTQTSSKEVGD